MMELDGKNTNEACSQLARVLPEIFVECVMKTIKGSRSACIMVLISLLNSPHAVGWGLDDCCETDDCFNEDIPECDVRKDNDKKNVQGENFSTASTLIPTNSSAIPAPISRQEEEPAWSCSYTF